MKRVQTALALATVLLALVGDVFAQRPADSVKTELSFSTTHFAAGAPIMVDVWARNTTGKDVPYGGFSPLSSSVGTPQFFIRRVPDGPSFSLPPGLYGDGESWDDWYQPASGRDAYSSNGFTLSASQRIHLLRGDLRLTVLHALHHCQRTLDEKSLLERPDNANTKRSYQAIVASAEDFLKGGTFDVSFIAYPHSSTVSYSPSVRITIAPPASGSN